MSDPTNHKFDTSKYVKLDSASPRADGELEAVRKLLIAERERSEWLLDIIEMYAQDIHRSITTGDFKIGQHP